MKRKKKSLPPINDEDAKAQQNGDVDSANGDQEPRKFFVRRVTFDLELTDLPEKDVDSSEEGSPDRSAPERPSTPEQFTFGYATNEAIPMTIFYRSQHSQGHGGKQRPTLPELRKGLEKDKVRKYMLSCLTTAI